MVPAFDTAPRYWSTAALLLSGPIRVVDWVGSPIFVSTCLDKDRLTTLPADPLKQRIGEPDGMDSRHNVLLKTG